VQSMKPDIGNAVDANRPLAASGPRLRVKSLVFSVTW
jgi:hypothetical protein